MSYLNDELTSRINDVKVLKRIEDYGLSKEDLELLLIMNERETILKQYDFNSLTPDAKGQYRIWVTDPLSIKGKKRLYGKNLEILKEKVYEHVKGIPHHNTNSSVTFKIAFETAEHYSLHSVAPEKQASRDNTVVRDESEYNRFIKNTELENMLIDCISVQFLDAFIRKTILKFNLTKHGRNSLRTIINKTFARASYMNWIHDNPARCILWKDYNGLLRPPTSIKKRFYTDEECKAFILEDRRRQQLKPDYIPAYAHEMQNLTGMRRGELCPILIKDIDLEKGSMYIHQELIDDKKTHRRVLVDYTKNQKDRYYPIADLEKAFFKKMFAVHDQFYPNSPFLFPGNSEYGCMSIKAVEDLHTRECKKLDIPVLQNFRKGPHAFRRSRITEAIDFTNGNAQMVADMFGNSPETIRKHYYTGSDLKKQRDALNKRKII